MSFFSKRNFRYNEKIPLPEGLINGQGLGAVSGMKFGLSNMSRSGCEVIAVYNALLLHGRRAQFLEIARYMERFRVLLGFWGTNFLSLGHCLKHYGLHAKRVRRPEPVAEALDSGKTVVFVYWCGKRLRSSVHTVCLQKGKSGLLVYNAYNSYGRVYHAKYEDYLKRRSMIFGYIIQDDPQPETKSPAE
ncbi:MAG: hypothetical protein IJL32_14865 [Oscillospiraceae bacterium]|nr:hypothetical protein [Oscillospiraceae bacterium]